MFHFVFIFQEGGNGIWDGDPEWQRRRYNVGLVMRCFMVDAWQWFVVLICVVVGGALSSSLARLDIGWLLLCVVDVVCV